MKKHQLLVSFIILTIFYLSVSMSFWLYQEGASTGVFDFFKNGKSLDLSFLNSPIFAWSAKIGLTIIASLLAGLFAYYAYFLIKENRKNHKLSSSSYNGVRSSLGPIPLPDWIVDRDEKIRLTFSDEINKIYKNFSEAEQSLFSEIIGVLYHHPNADVGAGHVGNLLEHTVHVLNTAIRSNHKSVSDPLTFLSIAAHDVGKIFSTDKKLQEKFWVRNGYHDEFSGLIVSTLPSFMKLPADEQRLLQILLKYGHKPNRSPIIDNPALKARYEFIREITSLSDKTATKNEKEKILSEMSIPDIFDRVFWNAFSNCRYMTKEVGVGGQADSFKLSSNQVLLLENMFVKKILLEMNEEERAVFNNGARSHRKLSKLTQELVKYLKSKSLLITKYDDMVSKSGLWNFKSGRQVLKGALFIEVPEDKQDYVGGESKFELSIEGPTLIIGDTSSNSKSKKTSRDIKKETAPRPRGRKAEKTQEVSPNKNPPNTSTKTKNDSGEVSNKPNASSSKKHESPKRRVKRPLERKSAEKDPRKGDEKRLTPEERREKFKPKAQKETERILGSLDQTKKKIEEESMKKINEAQKKLEGKTLAYEEAKIELDYLVAQKIIEINSPYYIAYLEGIKEISPISDTHKKAIVKRKKHLDTSAHMNLIKAGIL